MLAINATNEGEAVVVELRGRLDAIAAPDLENRLHEILEGGARRVALDLGGLEFVASAGLRVFLAFAKLMKKGGGRLVFFCLTPEVRNVFDMTGFTEIFSVLPSREEGLQSLSA